MKTILLTLLVLFASAVCAAGPMDGLELSRGYSSGRVSSSDPWGGNGDGTQWNPLKAGQTRTIAEIHGPGKVTHLWMTLAPFDAEVLRGLVLRMYWDGEKTPSVEAPIGAFFGLGHGKEYSFDSLAFSIVNNRGLNCFFPMPFASSARITLENQSPKTIEALYYYIDYARTRSEPPSGMLYFHAQYRQARPALSKQNYVALEATGRGHYVGMFYYIRSNAPGWWGEGDDMIYIDGAKAKPTLAGTGLEDYFCGAWGMKEGQCFLRSGAPLWEVYKTAIGNENTAYRWHLEDAIAFNSSIRVTMEHGSQNDRNDDFFSVAFWYQTHPHAAFPALPPPLERLPYSERKAALKAAGHLTELKALLRSVADKAVDKQMRAEALQELKTLTPP